MAIQVIIRRKIKQGHQAKELVPLILRMRAQAMYQPGYISGETLCDVEHRGECVVVSKWETIEEWKNWSDSQERVILDEKIEALTGQNTEYHVYSSMLPETFAKQTNHK